MDSAKLGGIEPLVTLIVDAHSEETLANAQSALISLASKHNENRREVAKLLVKLISKQQVACGAVNALSTASVFAEDGASNQVALANASAVPQLIIRLTGPDEAMQREAAHALLCMSSGNTVVQSLIARSAGVPALIDLVNKGNIDAQKYAAHTLWHLANGEQASGLISSSGGIRSLVSMLAIEDVEGQEIAVATISRISHASASLALSALNEGAMGPLVRLLTHGSAAAQLQAALAIANISGVTTARDAIAESGGILALVALLNGSQPIAAETAALAISNLSASSDEQHATFKTDLASVEDATTSTNADKRAARRKMIVDANGISKLVQMLHASDKGTPSRRRTSVTDAVKVERSSDEPPSGSTRMISTDETAEYEAAFEDAPAAPAAMDPGARHDATHTYRGGVPREVIPSIGIACRAASTLSDLAEGDQTMQEAIVAAGGVRHLLQLLRDGNPLAQEHATRAILQLCDSTSTQRIVVECGAIAELVALSKSGTVKAQELAAGVISALAKTSTAEPGQQPSAHIGAIVEAGGIVPLIGMLTTGNVSSKERAASALHHLSVDVTNQAAITRAGGIPPLVALLEHDACSESAADCLAHLALDSPENQVQIAKRLVTLLAPSASAGAQQRAAEQLRVLSQSHDGAAARVVNAGAIAPLIVLLGNGSQEAQGAAAGVLSSLAKSDDSNQLAIATGLVGLLRLQDPKEIKEQTAALLVELAEAADIQEVISRAGRKARLLDMKNGAAKRSPSRKDFPANVAMSRRSSGQWPDKGLLDPKLMASSSSANALRSLLDGASPADALRSLAGEGISSSTQASATHTHAAAQPAGGALRSVLEVSQTAFRAPKRQSLSLSMGKAKQTAAPASPGRPPHSNRAKPKNSQRSPRRSQRDSLVSVARRKARVEASD